MGRSGVRGRKYTKGEGRQKVARPRGFIGDQDGIVGPKGITRRRNLRRKKGPYRKKEEGSQMNKKRYLNP